MDAVAAAAAQAADALPDVDAMAGFDMTKPEGRYAYDAVTRCSDVHLPNGHGADAVSLVRRATPEDGPMLRAAEQRLKQFVLSDAEVAPAANSDSHQRLHVAGGHHGDPVRAWVTTINSITGASTDIHLRPGTAPPYVHMATPPTPEQTIQLFTLSAEQGVAFLLIHRAFMADIQHQPQPPLHLMVVGGPGTGKSQTIKAALWHTFQHGHRDWLATTAYTWCAVITVNTPYHRGLSTSTMFQLGWGRGRQQQSSRAGEQVRKNVPGGAVSFDELSFLSLQHLGQINASASRHLQRPPHLSRSGAGYSMLAGRHVIMSGDILQHRPPNGRPLYTFAEGLEKDRNYLARLRSGDTTAPRGIPPLPKQKKPRPPTREEEAGLDFYRAIAFIILLSKQQRQDDTPSGRLLTRLASVFSGGQDVNRRTIEELVRQLNSRVVPDLAALGSSDPRVVLQRNQPRHGLNIRLIKLQAAHQGRRLVVWKARHARTGHNALPLNEAGQRAASMAPDEGYEQFTPDTWYFEGAKFLVLDNNGPDAGSCHNNTVVTCGLLTDKEEPDDTGEGPYRRLQFVPRAVFVRPAAGNTDLSVLRGLLDYDETRAAFVVTPRWSGAQKVVFPDRTVVSDGEPAVNSASLKRFNIPLGDAYAVEEFGGGEARGWEGE
ncbi:hypothetical protein Agub_g4439 [Astrephomene gubernaculifera]|uniref:Uncharacterized protein n=1 Tax=Astrephomene gubernaculifera TaxID=47775 RepID=A0AAD3HJV7_9CHLO|nr:hypothetical protein Agub_g4439 [Astrephomene gubernaculifera]